MVKGADLKDQPIKIEDPRVTAGLALGRQLQADLKAKAAAGRRNEFLAALRAEPTRQIKDLLADFGMANRTYQGWRARDPQFALEVDTIRMTGGVIAPWQGSFEQWRWEFLGRKTFWHHRLIIEAIEGASPDDAILFLLPPEAGKTTLFEEYCTYRICMDPTVRIQYMCQSPTAAHKRINQIKAMLTEPGATTAADGAPGKLIARFGPFYERDDRGLRPWTANYFTVARAPLRERNFTLEARGVTSNIQGDRADLFLIDDPQDRELLNQSKKILEKIRQEAASRLTTKGVMLWAATRVDANDVYDILFSQDEEEFFLDRVVEVQALMYARDGAGELLTDRPLVSYWPEVWPMDRLMKKKQKVGRDAWARCYMQRPLAAGAFTFSEENMNAAKRKTMTLGRMEPGMPGLLTIDTGLHPGKCAFLVSTIVAGANEANARLRLVEAHSHGDFAGLDDITAEIERLLLAYPGISDICVEGNMYGKPLMADAGYRALVAKHHLTEHEHQTGRNKTDADMGITALGRAFWRGEVEIPWASKAEHDMFGPLIEQHKRWQPGVPDKVIKQDYVIVVWLAWKLMAGIRAQLEAAKKRNLDQWRRHAEVGWAPMRKVG